MTIILLLLKVVQSYSYININFICEVWNSLKFKATENSENFYCLEKPFRKNGMYLSLFTKVSEELSQTLISS